MSWTVVVLLIPCYYAGTQLEVCWSYNGSCRIHYESSGGAKPLWRRHEPNGPMGMTRGITAPILWRCRSDHDVD